MIRCVCFVSHELAEDGEKRLKKKKIEWIEKAEIRKREGQVVDIAFKAIFWPVFGSEGKTFDIFRFSAEGP